MLELQYVLGNNYAQLEGKQLEGKQIYVTLINQWQSASIMLSVFAEMLDHCMLHPSVLFSTYEKYM